MSASDLTTVLVSADSPAEFETIVSMARKSLGVRSLIEHGGDRYEGPVVVDVRSDLDRLEVAVVFSTSALKVLRVGLVNLRGLPLLKAALDPLH